MHSLTSKRSAVCCVKQDKQSQPARL